MSKAKRYIVSENNIMEVMDAINNFLSQQTKSVENRTNYKWCGKNRYKVHETIKEVFDGTCKVHPSKGEPMFSKPLLAVSDRFARTCLPIDEGARVTFYRGNMYIERILTDVGMSNRFEKFVHEAYSKEEKIKHNYSVLAGVYAGYALDNTEFDWYIEDFDDRLMCERMAQHIVWHIADAIRNVDVTNPKTNFEFALPIKEFSDEMTDEDTIVEMKVDFSPLFDENSNGYPTEMYKVVANGETIEDNLIDRFTSRILRAYNPEISDTNNSSSYDDYDDYACDYALDSYYASECEGE